MPKHYCLNPHDPYAEREVLVEFEATTAGLLLIAAIGDADEDILSDLTDAQLDDLRRELMVACQSRACSVETSSRPEMHAG